MMQPRTLLLILGAVAFPAAGQLLLEAGARQAAALGDRPHVVGMVLILAGVACLLPGD